MAERSEVGWVEQSETHLFHQQWVSLRSTHPTRYNSTEAQKIKLPYAATGELVLEVLPADSDKRACAPKKKEEKAQGAK